MSLLLDHIWQAEPHLYDYHNFLDFQKERIILSAGQSEHLFSRIIPTITLHEKTDTAVECGTLKLNFRKIDDSSTRYWNNSPDFPPEFSMESNYRIYDIESESHPHGHSRYKVVFDNPVTPDLEKHVWSLHIYFSGWDCYKNTEYFLVEESSR